MGRDWLQPILDLFNLLLKDEQYLKSWNKLIMIPILFTAAVSMTQMIILLQLDEAESINILLARRV